MSKRRITRREFLYGGSMAAAALLAACAAPATPTQAPKPTAVAQPTKPPATTVPPTQAPAATAAPTKAPATAAPTAAPAAKYKEAPQFAELVKQGKLPPVDQRLPANPMVIKPVEKIGKYGGTWRTGLRGGQDTAWLVRTIGYEHLVRWDPDWTTVIPNVAESFQASPDGSEFTLKLRKGMKWSTGDPFTADDVVFAFDDVLFNSEVNPAPPSWLTTAGKAGTITKVDDYTVKLKFATPNGLFLQRLATPSGNDLTRFPSKYLKQFHKKYTPEDKLKPLIEAEKVEDWVKLFRTKGWDITGTPYNAQWANKDLPTLHGWHLTTPYTGSGRVVAERNPYYWKVDTEGNQLPYLDKVVFEVGEDVQVLVLKAMNGEIDMMDRHIATNANKAVFTDNMQKGGYKFFETIPSSMNNMVISFNLSTKDAALAPIFQNKDFRIGMSYAINRQELIDVVWVGQGEPWQCAPRPTSPFYNEKLAKQYTEYDVKKANEHLDKVLPKKDAEGFRLRPDGKRFTFTVEVNITNKERVDAMALIQRYWQAVGIDAQFKAEDRALLYTHKDANELEAGVWGGDGGLDVVLEPRWYFPFSNESQYAVGWAQWYNKDPRGVEPPPTPKKQMELYEQLKATGDAKKQEELMKQILQIAQEEFYAIGIALPANGYGIVKNNFKNVPKIMPGSWLYPNPAPSNPCQYYVE